MQSLVNGETVVADDDGHVFVIIGNLESNGHIYSAPAFVPIRPADDFRVRDETRAVVLPVDMPVVRYEVTL